MKRNEPAPTGPAAKSSRHEQLPEEFRLELEEPDHEPEAYGGIAQGFGNPAPMMQGTPAVPVTLCDITTDADEEVLFVAQRGETPIPNNLDVPEHLVNPETYIDRPWLGNYRNELIKIFKKFAASAMKMMENIVPMKKETGEEEKATKEDFLQHYANMLKRLAEDPDVRHMALGSELPISRNDSIDAIFGEPKAFDEGMQQSKLDFQESVRIDNELMQEVSSSDALKIVAAYLAKKPSVIEVLIMKSVTNSIQKSRIPSPVHVTKIAERHVAHGQYQMIIDANCDALTVAVFQILVKLSAERRDRRKRMIP